jgi:hypothetical protein
MKKILQTLIIILTILSGLLQARALHNTHRPSTRPALAR